MYATLIGSSGVKPVSVPKIENTYYYHYGYKSKRKVQTPVRNSWSDFGKKASSSQHGFQHFPEPLSEREKNKKNPGLKIESDSGINSIPAIKGKLGLFELSNFCQTVC